ncbi:hypothetical protein JW964_00355 [candidate division KSB1 bacterium]|nr:hypothetical protein [candidate division KSB1 bacterium]
MVDMGSSSPTIKILPEKSLISIIEQQKHLFWWVPDNKLTQLSMDAVVEAVLNNGDEKAVRHLFDVLGVEKVAEIFYRQTSGKRINYRPRTVHFFRSYFQRHAQKCFNDKKGHSKKVLVHGYDKVDVALMFEVLKNHLDDLDRFIAEIQQGFLGDSGG